MILDDDKQVLDPPDGKRSPQLTDASTSEN